MDSNHIEVLNLLDAVSHSIINDFPRVYFAECLFDLQNIKEEDAPLLYRTLLKYFREYFVDKEIYTNKRWNVSTTEQELIFLRYLNMAKENLLKSLSPSSRSDFETCLKRLCMSRQLDLQRSDTFKSSTEERMYKILSRCIMDKPNVELAHNVNIDGFETDLVLTIFDEESRAVRLTIIIEIDSHEGHSGFLKRRNEHLRDKYLIREYGVTVLRIEKEFASQLGFNDDIISLLVLKAKRSEFGVTEEQLDLMKKYLLV